jgi:hypothetical protein
MTITYEQLRERIPSLAAYSEEGKEMDRYNTFMKQAERWVKNNITGIPLFAIIETEPAASTVPDAPVVVYPTAEAQELLLNIICNKGMIEAIPFLDLIDSGSGFSVTNNQNLAPASKERVAAFKQAVIDQHTQAVEDFIIFLEQNEVYHEAWKGSETYSILTETFIPTLTEFRRYAPFAGSRLDFIAQLPTFRQVISHHITPHLSAELVDEIIEQLRDDDLSTANQKIIYFIKMGYALLATDAHNHGKANIQRAQTYILDNISSYPTFEASSLYTQIQDRLTNTDSVILNTVH